MQIGSSEGRDESACHLRGREVRDYTMYAKEFRQHVIATYLKRHNFDRADFWQKNVSYIIFYKPLILNAKIIFIHVSCDSYTE